MLAAPQLAQGRLRALPPEETIVADQTKEPETLTLPLLSVIVPNKGSQR